jgi:hypothetical protein
MRLTTDVVEEVRQVRVHVVFGSSNLLQMTNSGSNVKHSRPYFGSFAELQFSAAGQAFNQFIALQSSRDAAGASFS